VAQFLRARAWWRLDIAGAPALQVTRSVVSLLDAACYLERIPDSDPQIAALDAAGCFRGGAYDPGPEGWPIVTEWQLADQSTAGPADLLAELVRVAPARRRSPAAAKAGQTAQAPQTAQALLDRRPPRAGFPARHASRRPSDQRQDLHHSLREYGQPPEPPEPTARALRSRSQPTDGRGRRRTRRACLPGRAGRPGRPNRWRRPPGRVRPRP